MMCRRDPFEDSLTSVPGPVTCFAALKNTPFPCAHTQIKPQTELKEKVQSNKIFTILGRHVDNIFSCIFRVLYSWVPQADEVSRAP